MILSSRSKQPPGTSASSTFKGQQTAMMDALVLAKADLLFLPLADVSLIVRGMLYGVGVTHFTISQMGRGLQISWSDASNPTDRVYLQIG